MSFDAEDVERGAQERHEKQFEGLPQVGCGFFDTGENCAPEHSYFTCCFPGDECNLIAGLWGAKTPVADNFERNRGKMRPNWRGSSNYP
jgi:hypothetical protein